MQAAHVRENVHGLQQQDALLRDDAVALLHCLCALLLMTLPVLLHLLLCLCAHSPLNSSVCVDELRHALHAHGWHDDELRVHAHAHRVHGHWLEQA
jgi:hypothetical protein